MVVREWGNNVRTEERCGNGEVVWEQESRAETEKRCGTEGAGAEEWCGDRGVVRR